MDSCTYRVHCSSCLCVNQECKSTVQMQEAPSVSTVSYQLEDLTQRTPGKKSSEVKLVLSKSCVETLKIYLFHIDKCLYAIWIQLLINGHLTYAKCFSLSQQNNNDTAISKSCFFLSSWINWMISFFWHIIWDVLTWSKHRDKVFVLVDN